MPRPAENSSVHRAAPEPAQPLFRIPPFPGAKVREFTPLESSSRTPIEGDAGRCVEAMHRLRVGGTYWGSQPDLPPACVLVRSAKALQHRAVDKLAGEKLLWPADRCDDPWHMLSRAEALICEPDDEVRLIAAILGVSTYLFDEAADRIELDEATGEELVRARLSGEGECANPFTGERMDAADAVELCGFWRSLIDSNRDIGFGVGFAVWKQVTVAPLLWGGRRNGFPFRSVPRADSEAGSVAIWRARASAKVLKALEAEGAKLVEVEDGFIRSSGLGADCVPPLSITVDRLGPHYDPRQPSELELLLQEGGFDDRLLARARQLRELIVEAGLGKYERGNSVLERPGGAKLHILVPGQVEDDRSVLTGGCGLTSNLELLKRVRARHPDAYILYKPHPDVLAGHRAGHVAEAACLAQADEVVTDLPISSLIAMVDELHVNTSLAGFEALMRGKQVTTHGVPFYAGWGLTQDLGPVPARRTARRSLDELVAATLLLYPRYLDPVTGLPCPAEIVVRRLCEGASPKSGPLVAARRLQGKLMRRLRELVQ